MVPAAALFLLFLQKPAEPTSAAEWKAIGVAKAANRQMADALAAFQKACDLDAKDEESCYFFARTLFLLDRWDSAREPFEKALRAASRQNAARVHRAIALNWMALGETDKAELQFRRAIASNGGHVSPDDPRVDYGAFLFRQGRLAEALPVLREAVEALPRSARARMELGRVLLHHGEALNASASLEKAVSLDPGLSAARLLLGRAYLQLGKVEQGERQLQLGRDAGSSNVR